MNLQDLYRAERSQTSGSAIYRPAPSPASRQSIYVENQYQGLAGYQGGSADKLDRKAGESTESWRRRVLAVARHLPEEEVAARLAAIDAAEQPQTHERLRTDLDASGVDRGILGGPMDRAAVIGSRFGGRQLVGQGHLAAAALETPGQPSLSLFDRLPKPQVPYFARLDASEIRSTGDGIL